MEKLIILLFSLLIIISCHRDNETEDTIIGHWKLSEEYVNGKPVPLNECRKQSSIEIKDIFSIKFGDKFLEDGNCTETFSYAQLYKQSEISYIVDPSSLFDQKQMVTLQNNVLIYSWNSWKLVDNDIISTPIICKYTRK